MANYELSNRIYELRTQKGLSQKELGAILGVSNKAVSKWETGTAIPKTETLIKLAEVFEISTEELLNMAMPIQIPQQSHKGTMIYPSNARVGKTLSEFRAEYGLYLKDIAEKIGVSEEELQSVEDSNLVPNEIAEKLVVAYNLPENNFSRPIFKSKTVTRKHFIKISALYHIVLALIGAIPMFIGSIFVTLGTFLDSDALLDASSWANDIYFFLSPFLAVVGCILLSKHLSEKTGYIGDFDRYKFLYAAVPSAAACVISSVAELVLGLMIESMKDNLDGFSGVVRTMTVSAVSMIFSLIGTIIIIIVMATLMGIAIEQNPEKRRETFKKIAVVVTASALMAYAFDGITDYILNDGYFFKPIKDFMFYGIDIAIVWLVYSITESNPKREKWAFRNLPLISILGVRIIEIIEIIGVLLSMLLEEIVDLLPF